MDLEKEQLKLRLIEAQAMILQYQHKEVSDVIARLSQAAFDASVDARDMPSGAPPDPFAGA